MKRFRNAALLLLGVVFAAPALAAVPAVVGTTLTEIQTDALAVIDLVWPVVLAIMGGFILIKLVKRGGSKI